MNNALIGAQMYTLREYCKTASDIASSCARVKAMGYDGIQASAAGFNEIDPVELRKILDGEGLVCAATHESLDDVLNDTQRVIEKQQILGCKYAAIGGFHPDKDKEWCAKLWLDFAAKLSEAAKVSEGSGVVLGYHNHSHEFAATEQGIPLQLLLDNFDKNIWFELDLYWVAYGGGDPAEGISKGAGRIPCVHYKDMKMRARPRVEHVMSEIGEGNLNWRRINKACKNAGVEWYLVERDDGPTDAFKTLEISINNMREMDL